MGSISVYLPSFSSDYSGIASVLFEYGGLVIIHNAACCSRNFSKYDEPRTINGRLPVYCSGLRDMEAILGDDTKLINKITNALTTVSPRFIAILGSPVPMLVGTDMEGIAREIEEKTGIITMGFNSTGFKYYNQGGSIALMELVKRFGSDGVKRERNHVNIIGMTPLDYTSRENQRDLCNMLESNGLKVNATLAMETSLEQVENIRKGSLNIVVSQMGLDVAVMMEKQWGIPYVVTAFAGEESSQIIGKMFEIMESGKSQALHLPHCKGEDVMIIHDQVIGNAIRNSLGTKGIKSTVGTFFGLDDRISQSGDLDITSEKMLLELLKSKRFKTLIADPLICDIARKIGDYKLIPTPHYSVSSRLYQKEYVRFLKADFSKGE